MDIDQNLCSRDAYPCYIPSTQCIHMTHNDLLTYLECRYQPNRTIIAWFFHESEIKILVKFSLSYHHSAAKNGLIIKHYIKYAYQYQYSCVYDAFFLNDTLWLTLKTKPSSYLDRQFWRAICPYRYHVIHTLIERKQMSSFPFE